MVLTVLKDALFTVSPFDSAQGEVVYAQSAKNRLACVETPPSADLRHRGFDPHEIAALLRHECLR